MTYRVSNSCSKAKMQEQAGTIKIPLSLQHHSRPLRSKEAGSYPLHHSLDDEISYSRGIATLVTRSIIISECRKLEEKQMLEREARTEKPQEAEITEEPVGKTEEVMVHPAYPEKLITIGGNFSKERRRQLITLLKNSQDVFAWEPSDMTGIPRRITEHKLTVNVQDRPVAQKKSSVTNKSKKRGKEPSASEDMPTPPPYVPDSSSSDLPSYALSFHSDDKEPICLAIDENVATSSRRNPKPKPAKQVLGLPSPKEGWKNIWGAWNCLVWSGGFICLVKTLAEKIKIFLAQSWFPFDLCPCSPEKDEEDVPSCKVSVRETQDLDKDRRIYEDDDDIQDLLDDKDDV
ncbi:hypothetical protein CTI12_AA115190 [Artemisia annua]|uniref:Reverse transcriptase domain-containing protein n=1 Tax=Artemisia annua TaxID=35608 RepID=A0A2U1PTD3_ARTAN|nr:hypothetical protein CTI12_AA115190 [Artemisia annua]